ncbi:SDR family oxidoreductase [Streptomyces sp. NPDC003011]
MGEERGRLAGRRPPNSPGPAVGEGGQFLATGTIADAHDAKLRTDVVDVTDSARVNAWIDGVTAGLGRLELLVDNAGSIRDNRVEDITDDDWHAVVGVSLTGGFHRARAALGPMTHQDYGRIVSFSSMSWSRPHRHPHARLHERPRTRQTHEQDPMRRTGRPQDIAEAAAFLASEAAGYITGVVLDVDGGISPGSSIR